MSQLRVILLAYLGSAYPLTPFRALTVGPCSSPPPVSCKAQELTLLRFKLPEVV